MQPARWLLCGLCLALALFEASPGYASTGAASDLFFSEYVEGSSNNKAVEIYNGTGVSINLTTGGYAVQFYFNGASTTVTTISLQGTLAAGDVFVLADSGAVQAILDAADQSYGNFFNGDDAIVLKKGDAILDVIGQIGFDPGAQWGTGNTSTADNTIRRKSSLCAGDADGSNAFDPSAQWDGYAQDTFSGLGSHTANCATTAVALESADLFAAAEGVVLEWQTVSEINSQGFHIQRRREDEQTWSRQTPALIPSPSPGTPTGQSYRWVDQSGPDDGVYRYRIDAVDLQGALHPQRELAIVLGKPFRQWLAAIYTRPDQTPKP